MFILFNSIQKAVYPLCPQPAILYFELFDDILLSSQLVSDITVIVIELFLFAYSTSSRALLAGCHA